MKLLSLTVQNLRFEKSHVRSSLSRSGFQKWPIFLTTIGYRLHDFEIFRLQLRYKLHNVATFVTT